MQLIRGDRINILSLFDGIGGARQALRELSIDCEYYASEVDKYAISIAKANYDDIEHIGDVKGIIIEDGWLFYNQNNDPINNGGSIEVKLDLLIGGSPCQDLSIAKKDRKGLEGERSSLFYEYVRILKDARPRFFILENVYSMGEENASLMSKELFDIEPIMINSSLVTAQQRKRLYWVGRLNKDGFYSKVDIEQPEDKGIYLKDIIEEGLVDRDKSYCVNANYFKESNLKSCFEKPLKLGYIGKKNYQGSRVYSLDGKSMCLSANGGGWGAKTGLYEENSLVRKLTPTECCRLQGFPDDYVSSVSKTQGYRALGNSFTVPVIKHILSGLNYKNVN
tara:strand:+ start:19449 stop:20456 length:1008 start_codon:yes stop_codon:yes gene_type:complete